MKILLTGASGYIGKRILPTLLNQGHEVYCCVRDKTRFTSDNDDNPNLHVLELDFLKPETLHAIPQDIDAAYFLMHSMSTNKNYKELELTIAYNFREALNKTKVHQVIYLSGISNEKHLSKHLDSRLAVEKELQQGKYNTTVFRAGIIIGSGSASFEIIRDLVEKLPIMVAPKWLNTKCQPIGVKDVIDILTKSLNHPKTYNQVFDIGGEDVLSYKEMLLQFGAVRGLKRRIWVAPVMTPRLSSYWLYFVTSTTYKLAIALVDSMKIEVVCKDRRINDILNVDPMGYQEAVGLAFEKIEQNNIVSSWKDSMVSGDMDFSAKGFVKVPSNGCFIDQKRQLIMDTDATKKAIYSIGGKRGWYYADWLWRLRGFLDKIAGGVGLRRGRTNATEVNVGDAVDFWRVLYSEKTKNRLVLYAEMKLPGEAWLEFSIDDRHLIQTATFRPKGLLGRLYWYAVSPFHLFIFNGLIRKLAYSNLHT